MNKKKTKKTKVEDIPVMTTESYVRENNHLVWEMREHVLQFSKESRQIQKEFTHMLMDVFCWADDNRQYAYKYLQYPSEENKEKLVDHIGTFHQFHNRMSILDKMIAGDKGEYVKPTERQKAKIN